jgi:hypothetical protein
MEITAFQIIKDIPFATAGCVFNVVREIYPYIAVPVLDGETYYCVEACLAEPEFFKPLY